MEETTLIQNEFENKRKLPIEVKNRINTNIFKNLLAAIIVMAYLLTISITYYKSNSFEELVKYYACGAAIVSVVFIEIAYNKKSLFFLLIGIELLLCGVLSIFIPYIYLHTSSTLRTFVIILPAILVVYYFIKSMIIYKKGELDYTYSLIDIKDILNDDKNSYLDEKSVKTYKNKLKEEAHIKEIIKKEQEIRKMRKMQKYN